MKKLFLLIIMFLLNGCANRYEQRIIEIHNDERLSCEDKEWLIKAVRDVEQMDPDNIRFQLRENLKRNRADFERKYYDIWN